jgi:hypothetical protein
MIIYPHGKELGPDDVRKWIYGAIDKVAQEQRVVIETFGDYSYGRVYKGYVEISRADEISEVNMRRYLETEAEEKFQFNEIKKM